MCRCGKCDEQLLHFMLFDKLEELRRMLGNTAITITSGYRCPAHNKAVGGATKSRHMRGDALDIKVKGVESTMVARMARRLGWNGIKPYSTWTHIDMRPGVPWHVGLDE